MNRLSLLLITICTPFFFNLYFQDKEVAKEPFYKASKVSEIQPVKFTCNRAADSLALKALYENLGGGSWTYDDATFKRNVGNGWSSIVDGITPNAGVTWNFNQPMDTWHGVVLNSSGCVDSLVLPSNGLTGDMFDINLPEIRYLNLNSNEINGSLPDFQNMPELVQLHLIGNNLSGAIPNFSGIPNILLLLLSGNEFTGDLFEFTNIPLVRNLDLGGNNLTGTSLDFNTCPELRYFGYSNNEITGEVPDFSVLPELVHLSLANNNLTGTIPDFNDNPNLWVLYLNGNELEGTIPLFTNNPNIYYIVLSSNNLTGEVPDFSNYTSLGVLSLGDNQLTGSIPAFTNMPALRSLSLSLNQLEGIIPPSLGSLSNMETISLDRNQLTGNIPPELGALSKLERLYIYENQLTGMLPSSLGNTVLEYFYANDNQLTGFLPAEYGNLTNLIILRLQNNLLEGCYPDEWVTICDLVLITNGSYSLSNNPSLPWGGDMLNWCGGEDQIGAPCNDGNPVTDTDLISPACACEGFCSEMFDITEVLCAGEFVVANGVIYDETNPSGSENIPGGASNGCDSIININLSFINGATIGYADAGNDIALCDGLSSTTLTANLPATTTGLWSSLSGATVISPNNISTTVDGLQLGPNEFIWSLSTVECPDYDTDTIIVFYDVAEPTANDDNFTIFIESLYEGDVMENDDLTNITNWEINALSTPSVGDFTFDADGVFTFLAPLDYCGQLDFQYELCNINCPNLCNVGNVSITVIPEIDVDSENPNVITPNGDKFNESLIFPKLFNNLNAFPDSELIIFNQWGSVVYETRNYQNDWNGVNKNGKALPQATYFYYFNDGQGEVIKGKVVILKE